eukprot:4826685-Heterocapsa_arctica.AAC.1
MLPLVERPGAIVADGRALPLYGTKNIIFQTIDGTSLTIIFYVSDVSRSILSVGQLKRDGYDTDFVGRPSLRIRSTVVPLYERSFLYYLPVSVKGEKFSAECRHQLQHGSSMRQLRSARCEELTLLRVLLQQREHSVVMVREARCRCTTSDRLAREGAGGSRESQAPLGRVDSTAMHGMVQLVGAEHGAWIAFYGGSDRGRTSNIHAAPEDVDAAVAQ